MARDFWSKRFDLQQVSLSTTVPWRSPRSPEIYLRRGDILDTVSELAAADGAIGLRQVITADPSAIAIIPPNSRGLWRLRELAGHASQLP
jgi:hypothetical protein